MKRMIQWVLASCRACSRSTKRASSLCARSIAALAAILVCGASVLPSAVYAMDRDKNATVRSGILADVAPSVLHIMGLQQPKEMTGQCLINE